MGKSGAFRVSRRSAWGSLMRAMVAWQTSARLNPQRFEAMPTAMPMLAETRILGKVVGSRIGSVRVPS